MPAGGWLTCATCGPPGLPASKATTRRGARAGAGAARTPHDKACARVCPHRGTHFARRVPAAALPRTAPPCPTQTPASLAHRQPILHDRGRARHGAWARRGAQPSGGNGVLAPEVVVQEAHLQVQRVRRTAVQRPAQVGHDLAARHLVAVAHQHHVPPARVLVQDVLRRMQPLVRLAPPAEPRARLGGCCPLPRAHHARRAGCADGAPVTGPGAEWVGRPGGPRTVCGRRVKSSTGPSTMQRIARHEQRCAAQDCTARYAEAGLSRGRAMPWRRTPRACCPCA